MSYDSNSAVIVKFGSVAGKDRLFAYLAAHRVPWCTGVPCRPGSGSQRDPVLSEPDEKMPGHAVLLSYGYSSEPSKKLRPVSMTQAPYKYFLQAGDYDNVPKYDNVDSFIEADLITIDGKMQFPPDTESMRKFRDFVPAGAYLYKQIEQYKSIIRELIDMMPYDLEDSVKDLVKRAKKLTAEEGEDGGA